MIEYQAGLSNLDLWFLLVYEVTFRTKSCLPNSLTNTQLSFQLCKSTTGPNLLYVLSVYKMSMPTQFFNRILWKYTFVFYIHFLHPRETNCSYSFFPKYEPDIQSYLVFIKSLGSVFFTNQRWSCVSRVHVTIQLGLQENLHEMLWFT